jgi:F-type H+-transporting ATPase subunit b
MGETFWTFVALVIFLALVWWKGRGLILGMLDKRTDQIRAQLDEAQRLREEAQALLAEYTRKREASAREAEDIVRQAREEAERMEREAEASLDAFVQRRRDQAVRQIAQAEADAVREVRAQAVEVAIAAARRVIAEHVQGPTAERLVDQSIAELPDKLH